MQIPLAILVLSGVLILGSGSKSAAENCRCGFYDPVSNNLFTESIIVYFNETSSWSIPGFIGESYEHKYEKGFNTRWRRGCNTSNIHIDRPLAPSNQSQSLELHVSPAQPNHLVVGGSLRTLRSDIQYGSFTSLLRSPGPLAGGGGSVLSMALQYNLTQLVTISLQNKDQPSLASISMRESDEFPDSDIALPYNDIINGTFGNGTLSSPWDFMEFRIDWTNTAVKYYIGGHLARSVSRESKPDLFSIPSPLFLRHGSTGNNYSSQGPPKEPSVANVGWLRAFFNSSSVDHLAFDKRCTIADACQSDDTSLRGSTTYSDDALLEWKQKSPNYSTRWIPIWIAVACLSLTTILLLGPTCKRIRERIDKSRLGNSQKSESTPCTPMTEVSPSTSPKTFDAAVPSPTATLVSQCGASKLEKSTFSEEPSPVVGSEAVFPRPSVFTAISYIDEPRQACVKQEAGDHSFGESHAEGIDPLSSPEEPPNFSNEKAQRRQTVTFSQTGASEQLGGGVRQSKRFSNLNMVSAQRTSRARQKSIASYNVKSPTFPCEPQKFLDHLAGLAVVCCMMISAIHFTLTFAFGAITPGAFTHYYSEVIARRTVSAFFLNFVWIGPFLLTSTRFLISTYLRTGDLGPLAEKTVGRVPRLMLPVTAVVLIQYFLIDCGTIKWLEYLPSVTWSTWPYAHEFQSFGNFLSEILKLMYLIPNAAPTITLTYCTGVLWTIPVQLQGSWLSLLAIIVIYEIKTPWKRFGYYAFCIVNHWYAVSWGSYFYIGILLTDLDLTYKWRTYLHARPLAYFPLLLFCTALAIGGLAVDSAGQQTSTSYVTLVYAIHSDTKTGLPRSQVTNVTYPEYFVPRLNGLVFAAGLQALVELSPFVQKVLSSKPFRFIFPHILSIYLIHGFAFWSLGSWLCIRLAVDGLPYWLNILTVAICSYTMVALTLPLLTPTLESLGKTVPMEIWDFASEEPVARKPTLYPFASDLFTNR
ncbi:hypothetical protein ACLMJK_006370 [Lecanora helva]